MAKKSGGGISIGSIVFLVIMYNIIFDDDGDKKKVEIVEDNTPVIEETAVDEKVDRVADSVKSFIKNPKESIQQLKEEIVTSFDEGKDSQPKPEEKAEGEIVVVERKISPPPEPKEESTKMKKL